jgi:hypothetical protein
VVTTLVCFVLFRTRGCGCNGHPAFPTPSFFQGEEFMHDSGASRREIAELCASLRAKRSNPWMPRKYGLLRRFAPRNDGFKGTLRLGCLKTEYSSSFSR